ncbi:MAG: hypothetical protein A3H35_18485 [Betaproteobacteria bacterium RIFCSPLOWO2_02_FULL_62_17]|nr:MAG: hypothetical protein A3H35_18485 [Betaproteobacteria bacterium RIFCSPLOWO2_02_FULL_62_17]
MPAKAASQAVAAYDDRPYFARALDHGLKNGIIDSERLDAMRSEGAKGVVQIADYFGTAHLRTDLDDAVKRMVYLASLYLEHMSEGNLARAARSLQENSFLSHSRGGSQMLKALFAMPVDATIPDPADAEDVKHFLRERSLGEQWSVAEYRARLAKRRAFQDEIDAALWFADVMQIPQAALVNESSESVLHACLLTRIAGRMAGRLLSAEELKNFLKSIRRSKKISPVGESLLDDVPEAHRAVIARHLKGMLAKDLPRIKDTKVAFNDLVREYHDRFHPLSLSIEVSDYDSMVTDEWRKVTRGKTDSDSMNTVFLCLAAGMTPKPEITASEAKAAILAIRKDGAAIKSVPEFVLRSAPHQMIDGLLALWEDEFFPEMIAAVILGDPDDSPELVTRILTEHCHIRRNAPRKS